MSPSLNLLRTQTAIDLGAGADNAFIGGKYWRTPGHMAQYGWELAADLTPTGGISGPWGRFVAFWSVLVSASFSYAGTEIIGICVGEVENPARSECKRPWGFVGQLASLDVPLAAIC